MPNAARLSPSTINGAGSETDVVTGTELDVSDAAQTAALAAWIAGDKPVRTAGNPLVLVTHQVNITALTGIYPRSGEIVVARYAEDGNVNVAGRLFPVDADLPKRSALPVTAVKAKRQDC